MKVRAAQEKSDHAGFDSSQQASSKPGAVQFDAKAIIALYADHGTHEQFHSEFKTDLDLERLPWGKFSTNYLVCELAALAMNILRLMGQAGLLGSDAPVRHAAKRRRIKTVMQELIYRAGRLASSSMAGASSVILGLGANDRGQGLPAVARRTADQQLSAAGLSPASFTHSPLTNPEIASERGCGVGQLHLSQRKSIADS